MMRMQLAAARPRHPAKKRPAYREQLIHEYLPYVKRIVQRIATHLPASVDVEDLMNVGSWESGRRPLRRSVTTNS
jgi:RNA polymerase sigma factor for flagellar operon FliA